ncbi:MAG: CoA transferase [Pseudomonadales bacterium]|nr:CoA transferase [Pseudomonadales bacterium]MDP6472826.1 CoA transferase [Pseudomonadales bacterium]MDP6828042.1 CoA transferase [Pseudomonadales bacterium]MDP6971735.1 CoA transferase [Pseudomonadales bacterium]
MSGTDTLSWINWKAASASISGADIHREGANAEWPVLPCLDGYVAMVYTERDWPALVEMINVEALRAPQYSHPKARNQHRSSYLDIMRAWMADKTKMQLTDLFQRYAIPAAAVSTPSDLLDDPLLAHRKALPFMEDAQGTRLQTPAPPHRITRRQSGRPGRASKESEPGLPLSGFRIVDLGIITAGAGTTALLADLGAEVIKIESDRYPDPLRAWAGSDDSPLFKFNNRNKVGVALDLKTDEGKAHFLELVAGADAVVENFRRGVLDRLGFSFDTLVHHRPGVLLASISGQGLDGPGSQGGTYGSTLEASCGFAAQTCYEDGQPYITGRNVNYPDQTVCLYAAAMVALALHHSRRSGDAMHLDISQRDVALYMLGEELERVSRVPVAAAATPELALEDMFCCSDARWVALAVPRHCPVPTQGPDAWTHAAVSLWCAGHTSIDVQRICRQAGSGAARAVFGSEMYAEQVQRSSSAFQTSPSGDVVKGFPFQFSHRPMDIRLNAPSIGTPSIGTHTDLYLRKNQPL